MLPPRLDVDRFIGVAAQPEGRLWRGCRGWSCAGHFGIHDGVGGEAPLLDVEVVIGIVGI